MSKEEWILIGLEKGIISSQESQDISLRNAYKEWFLMKKNFVKSQSLDRIEVTYNRYFDSSPIIEKCISIIAECDIITHLKDCILQQGCTSYKELSRLLQIWKGVLTYMHDAHHYCRLMDWELIKRNIPLEKMDSRIDFEYAIPDKVISTVMESVIKYDIYPCKRGACLCLCMNFFLGLRIGELASLCFNDFDFDRNIVRIFKTESKFYNRSEDGSRIGAMVYRVVEDTKTLYSVREIPVLPEVKMIYEEIKAYHEKNQYDSPYLAYDGTDTILVRSLDRTLRKLCQLCDVEYFNSHKIRKTFASMLHYNNVPTRIISDLLGHSEIGTTENCYIRSFKDNYKDIYGYMHNSLNYGN